MSDPNLERQNKFEDLRDDISRALADADLDSAALQLRDLGALLREEGWEPSPEDLPRYRLRFAHLAAKLGDARAKAKDRSAAVAAFHTSLVALREIGLDYEGVVDLTEWIGDSICRLFRYRLPARRLLENFSMAVREVEDVPPQQMETMIDNFRQNLPADLDQEISYWHHWSAGDVKAFEDAAEAYSMIWLQDQDRYLPKAAAAALDLGGKMQTSGDVTQLDRAANWLRLAHEYYQLLVRSDESAYLPHMAETLRIACNVNFKLRRFDAMIGYAEAALEFNRKKPGIAGSPEQIGIMTEALGWSYLRTGQPGRAVEVLEQWLPHCRAAAAADAQTGEPQLAQVLYHLGFAALFGDDETKAEEVLSEAIRLLRKLASLDGPEHGELLSDVLELYARLKSQMGRPDLAIDFDAEAERWAKKVYRVS